MADSTVAAGAYLKSLNLEVSPGAKEPIGEGNGINFEAVLQQVLDVADVPYTPSAQVVRADPLSSALSKVTESTLGSLRQAESMSLLAAQEKIESSQVVPAVAEAQAALELFAASFSAFKNSSDKIFNIAI